ncbi:MAG: reverse transcriptase family protein [Peptostreptococcaceae bacterium]|jgi:hypothetical protein|nr:reverse transcriptase family protein [Peptostreptococcaceae bacterium]
MLENNRANYRDMTKSMGKKEFTLLKMQEYGFWPKDLPTPFEKQENESKEDYKKRKALLKEYENIISDMSTLYSQKSEIDCKLNELKTQYNKTFDSEQIRREIARHIMEESIERRRIKKEEKELEKKKVYEAYQKRKKENIIFIGRNYSASLKYKEYNEERLNKFDLPVIKNDKDLANFLDIEYKTLRFLTYHRDVLNIDNYNRYKIAKKKGGFRQIAAPKTKLKKAQRKILDDILVKIPVSKSANGFLKNTSVLTGANTHFTKTQLLINMDIKDFFPTINFKRVLGMFKSFGYSPYISSLLAILCTYCERTEMKIKDEIKYIRTSNRILPQGAPSSPMITNIICNNLDRRLEGLSKKYEFNYSRYADDLSFSLNNKLDENNSLILEFYKYINKVINEEGFEVNVNKTRFLRQNNSQSITGIIINNEELGVSKKWLKILRATIYNTKKSKNNNEKISLDKIQEIKGKIAWLNMVNKDRYKTIIDDAKELIKDL